VDKAFVTGGSGLLGTALCHVLLKRGYDVYYGYRTNRIPANDHRLHPLRIELTQRGSLDQVSEIKPDAIIHTASLKNVDLCEKNPALASVVNVGGTRNVCDVAKRLRRPLVYISTNDVFDGERGNYTEDDEVGPLNVYARTKVEAEKIVLSSLEDSLVVRTTMHGWHWNPENSFSMKIIRGLRGGERLTMATDQFSSILLNLDLAEFLVRLLEKEFSGIVHLASSDALSRYDFAVAVAKQFGLKSDLIVPDTYSNIWERLGLRARRPLRATLNVAKANRILGKMPAVEDGIVRMKTTAREFASRMGFEEAVKL